MDDVLLTLRNISRHFTASSGKNIEAVDDVSLTVVKGETLGVVGESGCGKSTLGRCILRLIEPDSGEIIYDGRNLLELNREEMRQMRRKLQLVFQDPYASLDSRKTILQLVKAPLDVFRIGTREEREEQAICMLSAVGLGKEFAAKYPDSLSGGERQRIAIARALILSPEFAVCDEPVSSLDSSVRAQVLNLLKDLQHQNGLTYMFISHDLSVVKYMSDRIAVMYRGRIVELAEKDELYRNPINPYTKLLIDSIPSSGMEFRCMAEYASPEIADSYPGCGFCSRCPYAEEACRNRKPELLEILPGHFCACHKSM